MGKVLKIQLNIKKGEAPVPVESCEAVEGSGIRGDRHVGRGERDVCLCRKELLDWMGEQDVQGLCFYVMCAVKHPVSASTVNLKCPIVIHPGTREARQVIMETEAYRMRHSLAEFSPREEASTC